jgi:mannose-6-phosphate isomerase
VSGDHVSSPTGGVERFVSEQQRVDKPWGHELIFVVAESYVGKLLFVKGGESLSLQFHREKDEAWYVLEGRAELELGAQEDEKLASEVIGPGASFRFRPGTVHRLTALDDTTILEVSTPELDDVVRLEDRYGRAGDRD